MGSAKWEGDEGTGLAGILLKIADTGGEGMEWGGY